jgi:hypothetical protein
MRNVFLLRFYLAQNITVSNVSARGSCCMCLILRHTRTTERERETERQKDRQTQTHTHTHTHTIDYIVKEHMHLTIFDMIVKKY